MNSREDRIWPPYEVFYIHSMLFNTRSAVNSINSLQKEFGAVPLNCSLADIERLDRQVILNELQSIVFQGAALSRYFWPVRKGHETRAAHLRDALDITDGNPLESRSLRNAIEHFDERLDHYLAQRLVGHVFPQFVGPRPKQDGVPGHYFRAYYLDEGIFELLGDFYEIDPITNEILRIHEQLEILDRSGGRLKRPGQEAP